MPHRHSLEDALALAEGLADDGPDYAQVRACLKDQEDRKAA